MADGDIFGGYAVRWGEWRDVGRNGLRERYAPGAFAESLHRVEDGTETLEMLDALDGRIIASTANGTLALLADDRGLAFALNIPRPAGWGDAAVRICVAVPKDGAIYAGRERTIHRATLHAMQVLMPERPANAR